MSDSFYCRNYWKFIKYIFIYINNFMKIEQEELQKLQELSLKNNQGLYELGLIQNQIFIMEKEIEKYKIESQNIFGDLNTIKQQTDDFFKDLEIKYGKNISVDISTGEIV